MISLVTQPPDSTVCGQCCVAMLLGITMEEAIELVGHTRRTHGTTLREALLKRGKTLANPRRMPKNESLMPETAVVRLRFEGRRHSHFVVWHNGQMYDPELGTYAVGDWDDMRQKSDVYASSYWEVLGNDG